MNLRISSCLGVTVSTIVLLLAQDVRRRGFPPHGRHRKRPDGGNVRQQRLSLRKDLVFPGGLAGRADTRNTRLADPALAL